MELKLTEKPPTFFPHKFVPGSSDQACRDGEGCEAAAQLVRAAFTISVIMLLKFKKQLHGQNTNI